MKWITREDVKVDRVACPGLISDSTLNKYGLNDPGLRLLAEILSAAHSDPTNPHAAGEGLRWIAHGFSKLNLSDYDLFDREFIIYEALYAECKEKSVSHESK